MTILIITIVVTWLVVSTAIATVLCMNSARLSRNEISREIGE